MPQIGLLQASVFLDQSDMNHVEWGVLGGGRIREFGLLFVWRLFNHEIDHRHFSFAAA